MSWNASSGAVSYNLYRGTKSGGESATPIATGIAGTSFTNTTLPGGPTFYYEVQAVNAGGQSGMSNEAFRSYGVVHTGSPTLVATGGGSEVILSWTASAGAVGYNIYRGTSSGSETMVEFGITGTSFTDTGSNDNLVSTALANGTTYYYEVLRRRGGHRDKRPVQ